jgi:hypothetical protein
MRWDDDAIREFASQFVPDEVFGSDRQHERFDLPRYEATRQGYAGRDNCPVFYRFNFLTIRVQLIRRDRDSVHRLAIALVEKESLTGAEIKDLIGTTAQLPARP